MISSNFLEKVVVVLFRRGTYNKIVRVPHKVKMLARTVLNRTLNVTKRIIKHSNRIVIVRVRV
jgi:general stress protein CsbA